LIGILGVLVLLGMAWLLSYHKSEIKIRPIIWGIGLQLLFALIILRDDQGSFFGMIILGSLLITYMFRKDYDIQQSIGHFFILLLINSIVILLINNSKLLFNHLPIFLFVSILCIAILNHYLHIAPLFQKYLSALILLNGISLLAINNLYGKEIIELFSEKVTSFLALSDWGARFLFGNLANNNFFGPWMEDFPNRGNWPGFGFQFAFKVLPTIIFFGGFMSVLYYLGIMQKVILSMSQFMRWTIGTSGAETLSCSANIFVGQTEAPLLIKPFLNGMTQSELLTIMVGGFATIAGGVLAGYIAMGVPAGHLIAIYPASTPPAIVANPPTIMVSNSDCVIPFKNGLISSGASVCPTNILALHDSVSAPLVPIVHRINWLMDKITFCIIPK
jgi:CNT family concentrative nucleoside transporter